MCKKKSTRQTKRMQMRDDGLHLTAPTKNAKCAVLRVQLTKKQINHLQAIQALEQVCKIPAGTNMESIILKVMATACRHGPKR